MINMDFNTFKCTVTNVLIKRRSTYVEDEIKYSVNVSSNLSIPLQSLICFDIVINGQKNH